MTSRIGIPALVFAAGVMNAGISFVASVRPNNSSEPRGFSEYQPGGRFTATAITVRTLFRLAYRIQDYQLAGAPAWFSTQRYDVNAKAEDNPPPPLQEFLRALLADQFKLSVHNETRELPTFELVLARADGRTGPQLMKSDFDCAAWAASSHAPPEPGRTPVCATNIRSGLLSGNSIPMAQLATSLGPMVSRFTIDKTGLTGRFNVELTWTPDQIRDSQPGDSSGPSIFTAIQEQLGLKLVPAKGPVDVVVVDHVEKPSEN